MLLALQLPFILFLDLGNARDLEELGQGRPIRDPSALDVHLDSIEELDLLLLHVVLDILSSSLGDILQQDYVAFFLLVVVSQPV